MSRARRMKKEFEDLKKKKTKQIQILEIDPQYKSAVFSISGPLDSAYEGYWFRIYVQWPEEYPMRALKCVFLDRLWNPYIDFNTNKICLDTLQGQFSPGQTTQKILLSIISLLSETKIQENHEGFMNPEAAIQMMKNYPLFFKHARQQCQISSFKKKSIYSDQIRGNAVDQHILAQQNQIKQMIEKNKLTKQFSKKSPDQKQQLQRNQRNANQRNAPVQEQPQSISLRTALNEVFTRFKNIIR